MKLIDTYQRGLGAVTTTRREVEVAFGELGGMWFKASHPIPIEDAYIIMKTELPDGYNEFEAKALLKLGKNDLVTIGREYSPVVYWHTTRMLTLAQKKRLMERMDAQEFSFQERDEKTGVLTYRIWWD